ncbi:MAG: BMP family lipoprotein [Acidimicrobiales bacterium]
MSLRTRSLLVVSLLASSLVAGSAVSEVSAEAEPFTFGMILVGPRDDHGWSQAHYEAGLYLEEQIGAEMIVVDSVNPADKPETSVEQVVDDMVDQGAQLVFATSDDMRDGILAAAEAHPDVPMIWASGDSAWPDGANYREDLTNLGNIMGQMEYGKALAGCAAAMESETGHLAYLGPLVNDETRRLANAAFLGARHCWTEVRGEDAALTFEVTFIGFWFNIPGVTLDPTQVTNSFFNGGADVVISGIDTTEALVVSRQRAANGEYVRAVPYDFVGACAEAEDVCLGVPYFNWGPSYLETAQSVIDGSFEATWQWLPPDWDDINNPETTAVGFVAGEALSEEGAAAVDEYTQVLAEGGFGVLFVGPLNFQDGSEFLAEGETATESQVWYMPELLEGMAGEAEEEEVAE